MNGLTSSGILRKEQVQVSGSVRLGSGSLVAPVRTHETPAQADTCATDQNYEAEAKVLESTAEYVLVEVQCKCGEKMQLKCRY